MWNSLAKRLTYRIMAVLLVMMAIITGVVYVSVREYMVEEAQARYLGILDKTYEGFRRRLSDVYVAAKNNVHDIERDIDHPDMMYSHMERIIRQNPSVKGSSLLFLPDYCPEKKGRFLPTARRDSTGKIYVIFEGDSVYGYYHASWYKACMASDSGMWVGNNFELDHFPDVSRRPLLTTYATPVHNRQGTPVGLLCLQLSPIPLRRDFTKVLNEANDTYEPGQRHLAYCFVIDRHGNYIVHPDKNFSVGTGSIFEQTKETPDSVVAKMVKGENGEAMMDIDGVHSWVYYRTVKYVNWTMVIVVPEEMIFHRGRMLNTIILLTMLFGLLAIYFICRHMIKETTMPLHRIAMSADQVALGNFSSPLPEIKGSDEVRQLHDAFENMRTSLAIYVKELRKTTTSKAALERELRIAQRIQMAMLPKTFPSYPERTDIDLYASLTPARDVGGDLYDYFLRADRLFFCIGDVSGKGVPAALLMAVMRSMFRSEGRRSDSAAAIVKIMNRNLCEESSAGYFVTMFVGILDLTTGHLDYCNAGHEAPLVSGQPLPVKPNLPVGALSDWEYEGQQIQIENGDILFLYTDGLSEARNHEGLLFGRKHVLQLADKHRDGTARQLVQVMESEMNRHTADAPPSDDITLLAIKWKKRSRKGEKELTLRATMDEIGYLQPYVEQMAQEVGIGSKEMKRLRLVIEEAVANVINYAQASAITLCSVLADGQLLVTIDDDGIPFDPTKGSSTDLSVPPDQRPPGGMGIILMQKMTDGLTYRRTDGHNILTLIKKIT